MKYGFLIFFTLLTLTNCQSKKDFSKTSAIDIQSVSDSLTLLGENVISTPLYERDIAISPQGDEIIYTLGDYKHSRRCLVGLRKTEDEWNEPEILNISGEFQDIEPFYSHNGNRLYFASDRPIYDDTTRNDYNIWYSDRIEAGWSAPIALDSIINTTADEFFPSLSLKGNLFFTATREYGVGLEDIYISELIGGEFQTPKPLPDEINSAAYEFNAYISPEEHMIIFGSYGREDGFGGGDLYISYKDSTGNWTKAKNMGNTINSAQLDFCPFVDWQTGNFYFTSERASQNKEKLENVDELKTIANSTLNGFGNIYKIGIDELEGFH